MERTKASDSLAEFIKAILIMAMHAEKAGNLLAESFGLTYSRWQLLGQIDSCDEALTVSQQARLMGLSRQAVQRTCNELWNQGLLRFVPNPSDQRAPLVELSERGRKDYKQTYNHVAWFTEAISRGFDRKDIDAARELVEEFSTRLRYEYEKLREKPNDFVVR